MLPHRASFTLWNMEVTVIAFAHPVRKFQHSQVIYHGPQGHVLVGADGSVGRGLLLQRTWRASQSALGGGRPSEVAWTRQKLLTLTLI